MLLEESSEEERASTDIGGFENVIINKVATYQENLLPILSLVLLGGLDQVAVVTALFQLHHNIQETRRAASCPFGKSLVIPGQNPSANQNNDVLQLEETENQRPQKTVRESSATGSTKTRT